MIFKLHLLSNYKKVSLLKYWYQIPRLGPVSMPLGSIHIELLAIVLALAMPKRDKIPILSDSLYR